jgi:toxin ParE1/3/4
VPKYQLSNAADEDLSELYTCSYLEFGELRADAYFESLEDCLQRLATYPRLGMDVSSIRSNCYRFAHQRHSFYYRKTSSESLLSAFLAPACLRKGTFRSSTARFMRPLPENEKGARGGCVGANGQLLICSMPPRRSSMIEFA